MEPGILELDLTSPRPTVASALLEWAGKKAGGRIGAVLRRLGELLRTSVLESVGPAPLVRGAVYNPIKKTVGPMYHGTAAEFLPRILREGLRPFTETGVKVFSSGPEETLLPGVYLSRDPLAAAHYAAEAARAFASPEGVVLRVREVPAERLRPDEDFITVMRELAREVPQAGLRELLRQTLKRAGVERTGEFWRASFRLDPRMAVELGLPLERIPGTGTVAHLGPIPPAAIEVVERVRVPRSEKSAPDPSGLWPKTAAERERILNLLREIRARRKRAPWWLD